VNNSKSTISNSIVVLSISALAIYMIGYWIVGEKLTYNEGLGWDGVIYAAYARNFFHELTTTSDVYHVSRTLPSFIIFCVSHFFSINLSNPKSVVFSFYIFNNILYLLSAVIWYRICKLKNLTTSIYLFGFISVFISFTFLKYYQYADILTDCCAFFLGISILYYYLKRNYFLIGVLLLPCLFSWPLAVPLILLLVIFNKKYDVRLFKNPEKLWSSSAFIIGTLYALLLMMSVYIPLVSNSWNNWSGGMGIAKKYTVLSALIGGAYIYYLFLNLSIQTVFKGIKSFDLKITILFVIYMLVLMLFYRWMTHLSINYNTTPSFGTGSFITLILTGPILKPGLFLIMHLTFYGPIFTFFMYYYKNILESASAESYGIMLFMLGTYFLALDPHSRQLIFSFPFIVYFVSLILNEKRIMTNVFLLFYLAAAVAASKIYYIINTAPMTGSILEDPFQRFFMSFGLWTMWPGYFLNLALAILICLLLFLGLKFSKNNRTRFSL
jgi:hypothetical protein